MSDWKPIESAPKDGTAILIADNGDVSAAVWKKYAAGWVGWVAGDGAVSHEEGWYRVNPTHWMPLPDPPRGDASSKAQSWMKRGEANYD